MPNPQGRPKTPLLERLRTIYWSYQVLAASGADTADRFETLFARANGPIRIARGSWSRYLRGEITPQGADDTGAQSLVKRLGKRYPGTTEVFHHPIWQLLNFEVFFSPEELRVMYLQLPAAAWHQFISGRRKAGGEWQPLNIYFWRPTYGTLERVERLRSLKGLDGVAASILEARLEYLAQEKMKFISCLEVASAQLRRMADAKEISFDQFKSCVLLIEAYCIGFAIRFAYSTEEIEQKNGDLGKRVVKLANDWKDRHVAHIQGQSNLKQARYRASAKEIIVLAEKK